MARIGCGYGSECHLLRYLGRHREFLDEEITRKVGASSVTWLDFHFDRELFDRLRSRGSHSDRSQPWFDRERQGLDFLPPDSPAFRKWTEVWPQSGTPISWDAIGQVTIQNRKEWLLVEAKANLQELESSSQAKEAGGRREIQDFLQVTKQGLGVPPKSDWMNKYYQFCNRVAVLHFLVENSQPAHLVFIYFLGDKEGSGRTCPQSEDEWKVALAKQDSHVGLPKSHPLAGRIHMLFLHACPA